MYENPYHLANMYSRRFPREWAWRMLSSNQTFPPFIKQTHRLMLGSSTSFLGGKKPVDFSGGPRGRCTVWLIATDFPEAGWGGTPHRAKAQLKIEGASVLLKNTRHWEKALITHSQAESEECFPSEIFLLFFFFFGFSYHVPHLCLFRSKNNILSQHLPGKNMRWKNQSNVFPQGKIIQEKSLDNSQPGPHRLAGQTDITSTVLRNVNNNIDGKCSEQGCSHRRCPTNADF